MGLKLNYASSDATKFKAHKLKDPVIPKDMVVIIDTREQDPLFLQKNAPKGLTIVRDTLRNGDYSIRGFETSLFIERKKISDLVPYLARDHAQTRSKLERCSGYLFKALVIEATEGDLLVPQLFTQVSPETVRQALAALEIRYGLHIYYNRSRRDTERWVLDRLIKFYNVQREI